MEGIVIFKETRKVILDGFYCDFYTNQKSFENCLTFIKTELPNIESIIFNGIPENKLKKNKNPIDLSSLSKIKKISFNQDVILDEGIDLNYFDFDSLSSSQNITYLELKGSLNNYNFIQKLSNLEELVIDLNTNSDCKFFLENENKLLLNLKKLHLHYIELNLLKDIVKHADIFPNILELTLEGFCLFEDDFLIDPRDIVRLKKLRILRMVDSYYLKNSYSLFKKELDWCRRRELINLSNKYKSKGAPDLQYLGSIFYERSTLSFIDSKHLPHTSVEAEDQNAADEFVSNHGSMFSFQFNQIFLQYDDNGQLGEIKVFDQVVDYEDEKILNTHIYKNFEKELIKGFPKNYSLLEKKIHSFNIESNKMVIFDPYVNLWLWGDINKPSIDISEDSYILECPNGQYDVYSMSALVIRKKIKIENVRVQYSCCDSIHPYSKEMIIKKHGTDWFECKKCGKLIGGFNENIERMMIDEKGQKINFDLYCLDYQPPKKYEYTYGFFIRHADKKKNTKKNIEIGTIKNMKLTSGTYSGEVMINDIGEILMHGEGLFTGKDEKEKILGEWENGKFLKAREHFNKKDIN